MKQFLSQLFHGRTVLLKGKLEQDELLGEKNTVGGLFIICLIFDQRSNEKFCSMLNKNGSKDHDITNKSINHLKKC